MVMQIDELAAKIELLEIRMATIERIGQIVVTLTALALGVDLLSMGA